LSVKSLSPVGKAPWTISISCEKGWTGIRQLDQRPERDIPSLPAATVTAIPRNPCAGLYSIDTLKGQTWQSEFRLCDRLKDPMHITIRRREYLPRAGSVN
jgi:hypothetical protein